MTRAFLEAGKRALFMAPRHELIDQVTRKLDAWLGRRYGVIAASRKGDYDGYARMTVASLDTLVSRIVRRQNFIPPPVELVILDEAHHYITEQRIELVRAFGPDVKILGLTATPGRADGHGLGNLFEHMIAVATVRQLMDAGHLCEARYFAPSAPDLERIKVTAGDYNARQRDERMEPLLGDIPRTWLERAADRRTVVFASSVGQSVFLADRFRELGVAAEHCDGTADVQHRDAVFARFRSGETQVLCNVDLATYGFDLPELSCVVLARPTRSVVRFLQCLGRGLRAAPAKADCLVLDHAGAVHMHGKVDEERYWSLSGIDGGSRTAPRKVGARAKNRTALTCPKCKLVFMGTLTCPDCGYFFEQAARAFRVVEGDLVAIGKEERVDPLERQYFFLELKYYLEEHNRKWPKRAWKEGWPAAKFRERYGDWPPDHWRAMPARPTSLATRRWIKSRFIRDSRSRAA